MAGKREVKSDKKKYLAIILYLKLSEKFYEDMHYLIQ